MKIIITGATGFVGRALIPALVPLHQVYGATRNPVSNEMDQNIQWVECDLTKSDFVSALPKQADVIFHFAQAQAHFPNNANELFAVNVRSTQLLADYARRSGVQKFIFSSTGNVYTYNTVALDENSLTAPPTYYAFTKYSSERLLSYYSSDFDINILRLFTPYGPGQLDRMIPKIVDLVMNHQEVILHNGGQPAIQPIFIGDLVNILLQTLQLKGSCTVNIAGPSPVSVKDIATLAGEYLNIKPRFVERESRINWNLISDAKKMHQLFDLDPLVEPAAGIVDFISSKQGAAGQ